MRQVASAKLSVTWDMRSISAMSKGAVTRDGRTIRNGTVRVVWHVQRFLAHRSSNKCDRIVHSVRWALWHPAYFTAPSKTFVRNTLFTENI
jgi:hypothetical protein